MMTILKKKELVELEAQEDKEIWKDIEGYEGLYQVSNLGRVRSLGRKFPRKNNTIGFRKPKIKKLCETSKRKTKQGYLCTRLLDKNNNSKCEYVHILVANAFIPNPQNKPTVNHKDGNKHNNYIENLEWSTYSENNKHAIDFGLREKYIGVLRGFGSTNK